jgi:hypothetical protein
LSEYVVDKPLEAGIEVVFELVVVRRDDPILFRRRRVDTGSQRPAFRAFITDIPLPLPHAVSAAAAVDVGVGPAFQKVGNEAKFSFAIIFSANSRALRSQSLGVARMRVRERL